jgi:hypothetical protein
MKVAQLVKTFPVFYETRSFITALKEVTICLCPVLHKSNPYPVTVLP